MELHARRARLYLDSGWVDSAGADISALLADPAWKGEGLYLEGWRFFLAGMHREAEARVRASLKLKDEAERYRLLARIEMAQGRLEQALAAVEKARGLRPRLRNEEDYLLLLEIHTIRGKLPRQVWSRTLEEFGGHPVLMDGLFGFCLRGDAEPSLHSCGELTASACGTWWPESVEWRIRHARVLLESGRAKEMGSVLEDALARLDGSRAGDSEQTKASRREVFDLMKAAGIRSH